MLPVRIPYQRIGFAFTRAIATFILPLLYYRHIVHRFSLRRGQKTWREARRSTRQDSASFCSKNFRFGAFFVEYLVFNTTLYSPFLFRLLGAGEANEFPQALPESLISRCWSLRPWRSFGRRNFQSWFMATVVSALSFYGAVMMTQESLALLLLWLLIYLCY